MRRNRRYDWLRDLTSETTPVVGDLIMPFFVIEGRNVAEPIASMPNVYRYSVDLLLKEVAVAVAKGIKTFALFPVINPSLKDAYGSEGYREDNFLCRVIGELRAAFPNIGIIADVALDPYTSHGHDGIIDDSGYMLNDETVELLCRQAVLQAKAGCDIVAPSDMTDGRVLCIRSALDELGMHDKLILAYSVKYASALYAPFRDAVNANFTDNKKTYQMDYRNAREALAEAKEDIAEGADIIMVKPASFYGDIIYKISRAVDTPIFAYQVSGEYAALCSVASDDNLLCSLFYEALCGIKRAGASAVITYYAMHIADKL